MERGKDAEVLLDKQRSKAAVYMAGYAIEACLKAYYKLNGWEYPSSGKQGHSLYYLWVKSQLDYNGKCKLAFNFFIMNWSTDLRYCNQVHFPENPKELLEGAKDIVLSIQKAIYRSPYGAC